MAVTIRTAKDVDLDDIYNVVFERPESHIRKLSRADVGRLIEDGVLWIARDDDGRFIGSCYVKVPLATEDDAAPAEYGGAFVREEDRKLGIGDALARLAVAHFMWDNDPESLPTLVAHVHVQNEKPRALLARLGFRFEKQIRVPEGVQGFEHMPKHEDGNVYGDEFVFESKEIPALLRAVATLLKTKTLHGKSGVKTPFVARLQSPDFTPTNLEKLADLVDKRR